MDSLRLGFIGAGFLANFQAEALKHVRGVDLVGVVAPEGAEALADFARKNGLGDCAACPSIEELCKVCEVVCLFAPNYLRVELMEEIAAAVKGGAELKGVVCEKPLGRTMKEARALVSLAEEAGLATCYFENQLHMKPIQRELEQLAPQQEVMGPMTLVRSSEEHGGPHAGWFWDPVRQGGGVLSDMGCHSIAVCWYALTPRGKPLTFLQPIRISAQVALLKWGQPKWRKQLKETMGVDYAETPAEDFATGTITFRNPDTGQEVMAQFTNSWMYEKQGLRLYMDGMGPGYAFEVNTLESPLTIFIGDAAAEAVADAETALEKSTASRGLLAVQPNEADLYGYVDELEDMRDAFLGDRAPLADWSYGVEITKLCQAAYMSAETGRTIDLEDPAIQQELESYQSAIALGRGREMLHVHD
ncbi:MAG: Gfo/Idh/MocA family oxidoreductase [Candidatus Hydrogenedentes bacterium]|nr:Gfo/Idh/MocA family oxidoreductase [Candidatus Hydrogenedentota bacterium]